MAPMNACLTGIGLEDPEDLHEDFHNALNNLK